MSELGRGLAVWRVRAGVGRGVLSCLQLAVRSESGLVKEADGLTRTCDCRVQWEPRDRGRWRFGCCGRAEGGRGAGGACACGVRGVGLLMRRIMTAMVRGGACRICTDESRKGRCVLDCVRLRASV